MRILEINIYGYGKLENVTLTDLNNLNVFYGENEAGKSTIMSFIHSMLFGFPTKQQSELRYEPKKGTKYGGQLIVQLDSGKAVIERVKGKATGDVSVLLEDGTSGGEELLKSILSYVDKALYQSIFSFNIHGLQNVHQLKDENLGKFLFSTGTIGSERLMTVENHLQKEIDNRFKPSGKKPLINEKIRQVKSVYQELKKAENQNEQYGMLLEQREKLEKELEEEEKEIHFLQKKLRKYEEWEKLSPLVKEKKVVQSQIESLHITFPIDGLSRLDQNQQLLKPLEAKVRVLQERRDKLKEELEKTEPNLSILNKEVVINHALERLPLYETLQEELQELRSKEGSILAEIKSDKDRLHFTVNEDSIEQCNTSIFMKDKTLKAENKQHRLKERKIELDELFKKEKDELERLEAQIKVLDDDLLPDHIRVEKQKKLSSLNSIDSIEREIKSVQDQLHLLQVTSKKEMQQNKQSILQLSFVSVMFMLLTLWGIFQSQWYLIAIGGMGIFITLFFLYQRKKTNRRDLGDKIDQLKNRELSLLEQLQNFSTNELALIQEQLQKDSSQREQVSLLKVRWDQQNSQYERVIQAYESWEKEAKEHDVLLKNLGQELRLPTDISLNHIHEAFLIVAKIKENIRQLQAIQAQLRKKTETINSIKKEITELGQLILQEQSQSLQETAILLRSSLKSEKSKQQEYGMKLEKCKGIEEQLEGLEREYQHLLNEQEKLFSLANVESEEDFRAAGKKSEQRARLAVRLDELTNQLLLSSLNQQEMDEFLNIEDLPSEIEKIKSRIIDINQSIKEIHQQVAENKHTITQLEEGGVYTELLHKFRQVQSELELEAKDWAKYALAKDILKNTVNRFKEERLPEMLNKAQEHLSFLTDGSYLHILPKSDSSGFLIERNDHILFEANELSQATTEQVYVSLRLALATTIYKKYPFPIIIDDSFVNFDHIRTAKIIELLKKLKDNQILFFTCHQHLLSYFDKENVLELQKIWREGSPII